MSSTSDSGSFLSTNACALSCRDITRYYQRSPDLQRVVERVEVCLCTVVCGSIKLGLQSVLGGGRLLGCRLVLHCLQFCLLFLEPQILLLCVEKVCGSGGEQNNNYGDAYYRAHRATIWGGGGHRCRRRRSGWRGGLSGRSDRRLLYRSDRGLSGCLWRHKILKLVSRCFCRHGRPAFCPYRLECIVERLLGNTDSILGRLNGRAHLEHLALRRTA